MKPINVLEEAVKIFKDENMEGISLEDFSKKLDSLDQKYLANYSEYEWLCICIHLKDLVKRHQY